MLPEGLHGAFDQTVPGGDDRDGPAILEPVADIVDCTVGLALEGGNGGGADADVVVAVAKFGGL